MKNDKKSITEISFLMGMRGKRFAPVCTESYKYVMWQSENKEHTCAICRKNDGRIMVYGETEDKPPLHRNCGCKLKPVTSITRESILLPKNVTESIMKSDNNEMKENTEFLPYKKGRRWYKTVLDTGENSYAVCSSDGLVFVTYDNFKNIFPVEYMTESQTLKKEDEQKFFGSMDRDIKELSKRERPPMAYTYLMKKIYDWYLADTRTERAEIEKDIKKFRLTDYSITGIKLYDDGIKAMPKRPEKITQEVHYFRNKLNIEYNWKEFEKIQERLPEGRKWIQLTSPFENGFHQSTSDPFFSNRKYISYEGSFEAVYNSKDELLNEERAAIDMGTYNYSPFIYGKEGKKKHKKDDVYKYFLYENTKKLFIRKYGEWQY